MKLRNIIFAIMTLTFIATLLAAEPTAPTLGNYGTETLESLEGNGLMKLNGTSITNKLHVAGSLIAKDATIGILDIMGDANICDSTIKKPSTIVGSLQVSRTTFEQPLTILSPKALFTASHLESITVQKDLSFKGKQVIELKQRSIVNGPIHFESGKGEVLLFSGSKVLGPVTGGQVIKRK